MTTQQKLDKLTIRGFQSIKQLEDFQLNDINILIGANGAGKSNFINFFRMLHELVEKRLQFWTTKRGGADVLLTFGSKVTPQLFAYLEFGRNGYEFTLEATDDGGFVFASEKLFFDAGNGAEESLGLGHRESLLKDAIPPDRWTMADYWYGAIASWKIFHFHDTSDTADIKKAKSVADADYLRADASNLAAYLYRLKAQNPATYNEIRKVIQLAIPFFDDFVLKPQAIRGHDQQIRLMWQQPNSDYPMSPSQLSDGSLRFICLVTALLQPNPPATIIIDEPELGLHPYAITLLGSLIHSASKRMQIIISTQSVQLINQFNLEDLIIVERENDVSVFRRLHDADFETWLEDYTVGELWEKNILGGRP